MKQILFLPLVLSFSIPVFASDYGTTGLIDTPTARMQPDGMFSTTIALDGRTQSYALTYQVLPWLEGTFRYTGFDEFFYWDRNYEAKVRLLQESQYFPQISVGIRDLVGTGVFGSEYVVASKRYQQWDLTFGLGWGRLADDSSIDNPLSIVSERFEERKRDVGKGGTLSTNTFFSGPQVGVFGGVSYRFNDIPLTAMVEYNPDQNFWELARGGERSKNKLSAGFSWEFTPGAKLNINYQQGQHIGVSLHSQLNTKAKPSQYRPKKFVSALDLPQSKLPEGIKKSQWYDRLLYDIERSDLFMLSARVTNDETLAVIEIENDFYPYWPDALVHTHRLANVHLPAHIDAIEYIISDQGHKLHRVQVARNQNIKDILHNIDILPGRVLTQMTNRTGFVKSKIIVDATIQNRLMLFDPDNPLAYQFYLNLGTKFDLPDNWMVKANYRQDLLNNFSDLDRVSDSILPHVRSDALRYLKDGKSGLENLFIEKRHTFKDMPNLHYRMFAGVLETMFSGVGAELLYQPHRSRLAFGVSGAYAKQRDYEGGFSHLDYSTLTGHASVYWASPYHDFDIAMHVGRYLAKDVGATFEVRRTFANGWQLGLWATLTDVPFDDFGEGSFDKGMYFKIPFDNLFSNSKKSVYKTRIRPIQRDGGARLEGFSGEMWWDTRDARFDVFNEAKRIRP